MLNSAANIHGLCGDVDWHHGSENEPTRINTTSFTWNLSFHEKTTNEHGETNPYPSTTIRPINFSTLSSAIHLRIENKQVWELQQLRVRALARSASFTAILFVRALARYVRALARRAGQTVAYSRYRGVSAWYWGVYVAISSQSPLCYLWIIQCHKERMTDLSVPQSAATSITRALSNLHSICMKPTVTACNVDIKIPCKHHFIVEETRCVL